MGKNWEWDGVQAGPSVGADKVLFLDSGGNLGDNLILIC